MHVITSHNNITYTSVKQHRYTIKMWQINFISVNDDVVFHETVIMCTVLFLLTKNFIPECRLNVLSRLFSTLCHTQCDNVCFRFCAELIIRSSSDVTLRSTALGSDHAECFLFSFVSFILKLTHVYIRQYHNNNRLQFLITFGTI